METKEFFVTYWFFKFEHHQISPQDDERNASLVIGPEKLSVKFAIDHLVMLGQYRIDTKPVVMSLEISNHCDVASFVPDGLIDAN